MSFSGIPILGVPGFTSGGGVADYPDESDVVLGVSYSFGLLTGTFTCGGTPVAGGELIHSPAEIIAQLLRNLGETWPVYATGEPADPDNVITTFDTTGANDGSSMIDGEQYGHLGVQIRVRAATHRGGGWAKAHSIAQLLDRSTHNVIVTVDSTSYLVYDVSRNGPAVLAIGKDSPTSRRNIYTINMSVAVRQIED